ncbi:MAG TPA: vWA domain-containing protein, partial [Steroidobacteraceae bacterium]
MFELLFKYPLAAFQKGGIVLLGGWPHWLLPALILLAGGALGLLLFRRYGTQSRPGLSGARLGVIWLLEVLTAAVVLTLLWQPALVVTELQPRQNIVAVLVDDSSSMGRSEGGSTREEQAVRALQSGVLDSLQRNFQTRLYRFDASLTRISQPAELGPPSAPATHIGASLEELLTQSEGLPLGAVVLLSDGGDNSGGVDRSAVEALRNHRIPVYTVGFGAEQPSRDVEIEDVVVPSRTLAGSRLSATVKFQQHGYSGARSTLTVRDGTKVLSTRDITFAPEDRVQSESLLFNVGPAGAKTLSFSVEPAPGETNRANNTLTRLVNAEQEPRRVLYFEGEPRWEY